MKILLVDDELPILEAIAYNLKKEGYTVVTATDAAQCMDEMRREKPDLIVLDVMLPSMSGFDICKTLRKQSDVPIIMLTARADETDRVVGLELGADDYVTKPFNMRELVARIKSVLRRSAQGELDSEILVIGKLKIDSTRHEVAMDGEVLAVSPREFELLRFLASHPGQVFSRQVLLDRVWGTEAFVEERTVDVHMRWLREKIEVTPSQPEHIVTVRGVGYKFVNRD